MLLVNDQLSYSLFGEIDIAPEILPVELSWNSKKWLLLPISKPPKQHENHFREHLSRVVDFYSRTYDSVLTIGDFNLEENSPTIRTMINNHSLSSFIQIPTCLKSTNGRCIDLILTNQQNGCFNTKTFETGFSDFHHMVYITLKTTYTNVLK